MKLYQLKNKIHDFYEQLTHKSYMQVFAKEQRFIMQSEPLRERLAEHRLSAPQVSMGHIMSKEFAIKLLSTRMMETVNAYEAEIKDDTSLADQGDIQSKVQQTLNNGLKLREELDMNHDGALVYLDAETQSVIPVTYRLVSELILSDLLTAVSGLAQQEPKETQKA